MIPFLKKNKDGKKPPKPTVPRTAQESIPFQRMFEDGTCRVRPGYYTRTIQYQDINYQLAQQEDKTAIFEEWCSFLNFFDSSIHFELSFVNTATDSADFEKSIRIPYQQDGFDDVRAEYSQMLRQQLSKGNNGLTKTKFLTYGIEGDSMAQVKPRLEHIQNDLMNNFHRLGVLAKPLDGTERLRLMHGMLNMDGANKFHFNWKDLVPSGLSVKDAIAPTALAFKNSRTFQMGGIFGAVSFLNITASDLSDQLLKDFLDMDSSQIVTMHIQSVDQNKAIKTIKHTITELDRSKIEEQKKAVRAGYDMDVLPSDLATYGRDAKALLKELQSQNERMFLVTFLVLNTGKTEQELETNVFQAVSIAQKHNCELCRLDFQQEQGLMSSLPLGLNQVNIKRSLTTSSTAIFVPFTTQELFQGGEALYYGLNALSGNMIMADRKQLKNPNGLILGTPGSGKSFFTNHLVRNYYEQGAHILLVDTGNSYKGLCRLIHERTRGEDGIYITYEEDRPITFNPFYSEDRQFDVEKRESIKTLILTLWKREDELPKRSEEVALSGAVNAYIRRITENPELRPDFNGFYEFVRDDYRRMMEKKRVREKDFDIDGFLNVLEPFYKGGDYDFLLNSDKEIDLTHKRFIVFELDNISSNKVLLPVVTLIIMETFISKMRRLKGIRKVILLEEAWKSLMSPNMATYVLYLFKTVRKYFGEAVVVTQEVDDIISSPIVKEAIINNSDCKILLDQRKYLNKFERIQTLLGLTDKECSQILSINRANDPSRRYKEV